MSSFGETAPTGFLMHNFLESILSAITQEIKESQKATTARSLEIDGIRHLENTGGRFIYRLVLSNPVNFSSDQPLSFRTKDSKEQISATVIDCDDEGLVIESEQPLPIDAKLVKVEFNPAFIYKALGEYLSHASASPIAREFFRRALAPLPKLPQPKRDHLNDDQSLAVDEMTAVPIHLLWGPPGTGKTTTLGVAISEWMRQANRVLIVSTSNAAVDVAMRSLLKRVKPHERKKLLRLGTSLDAEVREITLAGNLRRSDAKLAEELKSAQDRMNEISELLSIRTNSNQRFQELYAEYSQLETIVNRANQKARELFPNILPEIRVMGCTLAKMVLDEAVHERKFDIVVVDEVSMVSLVYSLAASTLAKSHLILAGDPKQLPPICQSSHSDAQKWFGQNCYDWFRVGQGYDKLDMSGSSVLRTQYRMTHEIGGVVSRLSYGNILRHERKDIGTRVEFVDVPKEWRANYYSVKDKSYFHLSSVPIIHELTEVLLDREELLLLSPFRPQRSLLAALAFDLQERFPKRRITSSTIHRSQGSEGRAVIVDLTTHRPDKLVAFFRDKKSANLFNVGISRAQDHLVIIGSSRMLGVLAQEQDFWRRVLEELSGSINLLPAGELFDEPLNPTEVGILVGASKVNESPALYCHPNGSKSLQQFIGLLGKTKASRKLLVLPDDELQVDGGSCVVRHSPDTPPVLLANGYVVLPYQGKWLPVFSPNVARVVWRIGFSHLADEEVGWKSAKRFYCPKCATGELVLKRAGGEGWLLVCSNGRLFECPYRRRLSLEDAKLKVQLTGMTCPSGHPLTARQGKGIFLGCENYPDCDYTEKLSLLAGM